jgi:glycosyltransferase 2 family protein
VIDMVMFGLFLVAGILFLPSTIQSLFNQTKGPSISTEIVIALVVLFAGGIIVLRYILKHTFKNKWVEKFAHFVRGTWNAFASVAKIRGKFLFIALTFGIWMSWLIMTYFNLLALPGSSHMGFNESLFLLICASLAMLAPTPGGLGAYHSITVIGFIILGYADPDNTTTSILGLTYATISWATRTFAEIATGFVGFLIVTYRIRRAEHQRTH